MRLVVFQAPAIRESTHPPREWLQPFWPCSFVVGLSVALHEVERATEGLVFSEVVRMENTEAESESVGVRFTGRCVCGEKLEAAYNEDLKIVFWNCFQCFPVYERAAEGRRETLKRLFEEHALLKPE